MKSSKKPLCLVTGGAGFIGSNVVDGLLAEGCRVRVLDDLSTGKLSNLKPVASRIEFIKGDICDTKIVEKAVRGVDYVFHIAALRAVLRSVDNPLATNEVNVGGTLKLLIAARDAKVKRFIFTSSSSVYGDTKKFPSQESDYPNPQSPYAASKLMGEHYCRIFSSLYNIETVSLRYFNVFGPRQNPESRYAALIPILLDCLVKGENPEIHWDGKQSRDFSYVDNVVHANIRAMKAPSAVSGHVFNVACHQGASVLDILKHLQNILNIKKVTPVFKPKRAGDVRKTFADIRKAEKMMGYRVQTRLEEGLKKTAEWFLKERPSVS